MLFAIDCTECTHFMLFLDSFMIFLLHFAAENKNKPTEKKRERKNTEKKFEYACLHSSVLCWREYSSSFPFGNFTNQNRVCFVCCALFTMHLRSTIIEAVLFNIMTGRFALKKKAFK